MGSHVSTQPTLRSLEPLLTAESKRLLQIDLERVCLENIQTCILVANLCVAHENPSSEFLFFRKLSPPFHARMGVFRAVQMLMLDETIGTAIAMMQLIEPRTGQENDNEVSHELRIRIWWALFAADNWCSSSLGFPRQMKDWPRPTRLPMEERLFADMDPDEPLTGPNEPCKSPGLWAHMATLIEVFSPIQELNWRAANSEGLHPDQIEEDTYQLAQLLDNWEMSLPHDVQLTESNLIEHSKQGTGGIFMGLHLGFHHYATLLFYQYLDKQSTMTMRAQQFATRCKHHALSYSTWLARGRRQPGCEAVYPTIAHMAIVSSSVLLHTLLFGEENELAQSRQCLEANFQALLELEDYWPIVKTMVKLPFPQKSPFLLWLTIFQD
ncbi:hypothetical protein ZTR_02401 [Talaromyces verruculosus]|nr:hypothetical protein ZTR_02401 [Talaromyces verruculosus]